MILSLKLKIQYLGHPELTHWKSSWCWEGLGAGGEGWDDWMASPTWWTWVWVNSRRWWWTGRPGVLQFMGLQRVGHDWATELNWTEYHKPSDAHRPYTWWKTLEQRYKTNGSTEVFILSKNMVGGCTQGKGLGVSMRKWGLSQLLQVGSICSEWRKWKEFYVEGITWRLAHMPGSSVWRNSR